MRDRPFCYDLERLQRDGRVCAAWQNFLSVCFNGLVSMGADHCLGSWREGVYIDLGVSARVAVDGLSSLMLPGFAPEIVFRRDCLFDARAWVELPLKCFVSDQDGIHVRFSVREHMTFAPTSFRLQHQKRKGMRWGRLYCTDYRLAYRQHQVAQEDFPEDETREEMFAALLDKVGLQCNSGQFSISFEPLISEVVRANSPARSDGFCYEI